MNSNSKRLIAVVAIACLGPSVLGCPSKKAPEPVDAAAPVPDDGVGLPKSPPRFAWGAPISVRVEEATEKQGHKAVLSYWLDVCPSGPNGLTVTHRDVRFLRVEGAASDDPKIAPMVRQMDVLAGARPSFVIDSAGRLRDVQSLDDLRGRLDRTLSPQDFELVRPILADDGKVAVLKESVAYRWRGWVETWTRFDPGAGAKQDAWWLVPDEQPKSGPVPTIAFEGRADGGRVRLSARFQLAGDALRAIIGDILGRSGAEPVPLDGLEGSVAQLLEVETEWLTLRPWQAHTRKEIRFRIDGKPTEWVEDHTYRFDWKGTKAPGCADEEP